MGHCRSLNSRIERNKLNLVEYLKSDYLLLHERLAVERLSNVGVDLADRIADIGHRVAQTGTHLTAL